jgi:hypothetical protein
LVTVLLPSPRRHTDSDKDIVERLVASAPRKYYVGSHLQQYTISIVIFRFCKNYVCF